MSAKVYYLDDEPDLLDSFTDLFAAPDLEIMTFQSPYQLMEALKNARPDLIILDHRLQNITGVEIAETLDPSIPKAIISGDLTVSYKDDLFAAHFEKPFKVKVIRDFLDKLKK